MSDLTEFLAARLGELAEADWHVLDCSGMPHGDGHCCDVQRWLVRDVAAKRAILDRHQPLAGADGSLFCAWCSSDTDDLGLDYRWPCPDVRDLAAIYQDSRESRQAAQNPAVSAGAPASGL